MNSSLKVLFASGEVHPLIKVGGLADVAGALPGALRGLGHDVRVAMPGYGCIDMRKYGPATSVSSYDVPVLGRTERIDVSRVALPDGTPVYLLSNHTYFSRPAIYGENDDLERFLLFSIAVAELPWHAGWMPDIINCNDWHTGLTAPLWNKKRVLGSPPPVTATVFTVHNLGYQGLFDDWFAGRAGLHEFLPPQGDPLRSKVYSLMGLSVIHADAVSTVSETYAKEIQTPEYGFALETALQRRSKDLYGIVNGIDYEQFNPATDPLIPARYDASDLDGKSRDKDALQEKAGLARQANTPLLGMVGRLAEQKGIDLVAGALDNIMKETDVQLVLLGTGEEKYRTIIEKASSTYSGRVRLFFGFDLALAQMVYSGCDMFLMPSRYEPCGLGQLIALRYGTIPVVRRTGGLADTVRECSPDLSSGNGFLFTEYEPAKLIEAVKHAVSAYKGNKKRWRGLVARAMGEDYSWNASARKYESMYRDTLRKVTGGTKA